MGSGAIAINVFQTTDARLYLSDSSPSLVNFYKVLINDLERPQLYSHLVRIALEFEKLNQSEQEIVYYKYRDAYNTLELSTTYRSAIFYFLNKTSFNGVMRYNSKGLFNVPFGKRGFSLDLNSLEDFSHFLSHSRTYVYEGDFRTADPRQGDLIYLDPPYHPLSETANFSSYQSEGWGKKDEQDLREKCDQWVNSGAFILLSNHDVPWIRALFAGYKFYEIEAARSVGAKSTTRKKVPEVLISK